MLNSQEALAVSKELSAEIAALNKTPTAHPEVLEAARAGRKSARVTDLAGNSTLYEW